MQHRYKLAGLMALIFILMGCGSTIEVAKVKQTKEVAVPIITVNEYIDMSNLDDTGLTTLMQRIAENEEFDLTPTVKKLRNKTYDEYAAQMPFTILPESEVIHTEKYQNFNLLQKEANDERYQNLQFLLVPDGYKKYNLGQGALLWNRQPRMFGAVPEQVDALLFASADYAMVKDNPFWFFLMPFAADRVYVKATIRYEMVNREGETIMRIVKSAKSRDYTRMVAGLNLDVDEIQGLATTATERAFVKVDEFVQEEMGQQS